MQLMCNKYMLEKQMGVDTCMCGQSPIRNQEEPISWYLFLQLNIMTQ